MSSRTPQLLKLVREVVIDKGLLVGYAILRCCSEAPYDAIRVLNGTLDDSLTRPKTLATPVTPEDQKFSVILQFFIC